MFPLLLALSVALGTPCTSEGATNCYWSASTQGNQTGKSFVDIHGVAYYLEDK